MTITSCSSNICSKVRVAVTPVLATTTIQEIETFVTTYCVVSDMGDNSAAVTVNPPSELNQSSYNASTFSPLIISSVGENSAARFATGSIIGFIILALVI